MIDGINDTPADADALAALLRGSGAHVNLIPMNAVAHTPWRESSPQRIEQIALSLREAGLSVTVRRNRGRDAGAACGQLAAERAGAPAPAAVARRRQQLERASAAALQGRRSRTPLAPSGPLGAA
jgi:23S rRNA (adenine2503-C2)-methyltransferase